MKTLVVDDDAMVRRVLRRLLERRGHSVDEAADAPSGQRAALTGAYDLVILDHQMPGGDGASVAEAIGASPIRDATYVIMCTTMSGPAYEARIHGAGALGIMQKPFSIADVDGWIAVVEALMDDDAPLEAAVG